MNQDIILRVVHSLPGRVRLRMNILPVSPQNMIKTVKDHPGISEITFNPHTRSVLIKFEPGMTSQEELIIRLAVFLSLEKEFTPVRVLSESHAKEMSESAFISGFLILISLFGRVLPQAKAYQQLLSWLAGGATAYSIFDHGYKEFKERGNFDPEVLSVIYLLTSFSQGRFFTATLFAWIATFGRHLIRYSSENVEIKPQPVQTSQKDKAQYKVVINPLNQLPGRKLFFNFLPMVIMNIATGNRGAIEGTLMDEMRKVSADHDQILEGFGKFKNGMPVQIQYQRSRA